MPEAVAAVEQLEFDELDLDMHMSRAITPAKQISYQVYDSVAACCAMQVEFPCQFGKSHCTVDPIQQLLPLLEDTSQGTVRRTGFNPSAEVGS